MDFNLPDDLAWAPSPLASSVSGRSSPPIVNSLELDEEEVASGIWHDDFLILGSRLRDTYGDCLDVDRDVPAYLVPFEADLVVSVGCPIHLERADRVRVVCPIVPVPDEPAGFFEFALRESATLPLAKLSLEGDWLAAGYELPFAAAGTFALRSAVSVVGWAARSLRPELAIACQA